MKINKRKSGIMWAISFIVLALVILAAGFGLFQTPTKQLVMIIILGLLALANLIKLNWFPFFGLLAVIAHINKEQLGLESALPVYIAALLLALGFQKITSIIRYRKAKINIETGFKNASFSYDNKSQDGQSSIHGNHIKIENNFSEKTQYIQSELLQSAFIENNFGSLRVYFDKAQFDPSGVSIEINNNFGKTTLYMPGNIYLDNQLDVSFGHASKSGSQLGNPADPHVIVTGEASFGSIDIVII